MLLLVITVFLLFLYGMLMIYYTKHWITLPVFTPVEGQSTLLSVVVAARNEETTLPVLLQHLTRQRYPENCYEVIIVDDFSTDETAMSVQAFLSDRIRMIQPEGEPRFSTKKKAIAAGVKAAKHPLILVTDADCIPSQDWLSTIASFYKKHSPVFVAAPVQYVYNNTFLEKFQALDFMVLQGITGSSVGAGFHAMCNGANLAYEKQAFEKVSGFSGIDKLASGDDMLLMHKIWNAYPARVLYLKSSAAIMKTAPMRTWAEFISQRKRWASKSLYYQDGKIKWVLALVYLVNLWFAVLIISSIIQEGNARSLIIFFFGKILIELPFMYAVADFYREKKLLLLFPLFQPVHMCYTIIAGALGQAGSYQWKGRKMK